MRSGRALTWPGEHYRMLVARLRSGAMAIRSPSWNRHLCRSLGVVNARVERRRARTQRSTSFPWCSFPFSVLRHHDFGLRLEQRLGDLADPAVFAANADVLADADIVFVDAAKDGVFEYRFLPRLLGFRPGGHSSWCSNDVRVLPMVNPWRSLPLPKLDIASFGHWSGTGLIDVAWPWSSGAHLRLASSVGSDRCCVVGGDG